MEDTIEAPFGAILVAVDEQERVRSVRLQSRRPEAERKPLPRDVREPFEAYLGGESPRPDVPVADLDVTEFQRRVFDELTGVPPGSTVTYGELARRLDRPRAARAVGQALQANPVPLVWPCHRVVASDGLGGFGGCPAGSGEAALAIKRWLLEHEETTVSSGGEQASYTRVG